MRFLFAGGGTGGHIFPAIAIADEIRKIDTSSEILFIGAKGRIEEKIVPSNNYRLETIEISGINRENLFRNFSLPEKLFRALKRCGKLIKEFMPDVAIGTGGFVCGPVIYKAQRLGVPTLIQEGNAFAGKTIKFLAPGAKRVVINFEETLKYLKRKDNVIRIGHPVRSSLMKIDRHSAAQKFGVSPERKTLLVFGGSQGARGINDMVSTVAEEVVASGINLIWQTGSKDFKPLSEMFRSSDRNLRLFEFIDQMDIAYSASDLAICRAGITSIMELSLMRLPSILVPLPGSAEDHQAINANTFEALGACIVVNQQNGGQALMKEINILLESEEKREQMSVAAGNFADPLAAQKIAEEVFRLAESKQR